LAEGEANELDVIVGAKLVNGQWAGGVRYTAEEWSKKMRSDRISGAVSLRWVGVGVIIGFCAGFATATLTR